MNILYLAKVFASVNPMEEQVHIEKDLQVFTYRDYPIATLTNLYPEFSSLSFISFFVIRLASYCTMTESVIKSMSIFLIACSPLSCFSTIGLQVVQYIPTTLKSALRIAIMSYGCTSHHKLLQSCKTVLSNQK